MSLRFERHVARTNLKTIRGSLITVVEFKIQYGLAIVAKRKETALEVASAHGEARRKARRVRNRYLHIARAHAYIHRLRGGLVELERHIARTDLGIQGVGHGTRKLDVSRVQRQIEVVARNVRDRQIARSYIRCNAHHVIGNFARQFDGNRAVNGALVIAIELANLERRTLNHGQILGCRIVSSYSFCDAATLDDTYRPVGDALDLNRPRRNIQIKGLK